MDKTSIKQLQVAAPLRMNREERFTWKTGPIWRHLSFYMLLHCDFIVTLCIMSWNFKHQNLVFSLLTITYILLLPISVIYLCFNYYLLYHLLLIVSAVNQTNACLPIYCTSELELNQIKSEWKTEKNRVSLHEPSIYRKQPCVKLMKHTKNSRHKYQLLYTNSNSERRGPLHINKQYCYFWTFLNFSLQLPSFDITKL